MHGKIIRGVGGFYYVYAADGSTYECRAKGIFRREDLKPLVGDDVDIEVIDPGEKTGNVCEIHERKASLIRPEIANADLVVVVFSLANPSPALKLLDRYLVQLEFQAADIAICFNKKDICRDESERELEKTYSSADYRVIFTSASSGEGIDALREMINAKTSVLAGPSGVGKSSILNALVPDAGSKTGDISKKLGRGKHTTRHSEIFRVKENTFIMDTPGFGSVFIPEIDKTNLRFCFPEMAAFEGKCRFSGCLHVEEPGCALKEAVRRGEVAESRYQSYVSFFRELESERKF